MPPMRNWSLRILALLAAGVLLTSCGGSSKPSAPTKSSGAGHPFPAAIRTAFQTSCIEQTTDALPTLPPQGKATVTTGVEQYCTCVLGKIEGAVSVTQYEHDLAALKAGKEKAPAYVKAELPCATRLKQTLQTVESS
jgi:hypothetical protein